MLSHAPTTVADELTIDLPDARDQLTTRGDPRFTELRSHVYAEIQRAKRHASHPPENVAVPTL